MTFRQSLVARPRPARARGPPPRGERRRGRGRRARPGAGTPSPLAGRRRLARGGAQPPGNGGTRPPSPHAPVPRPPEEGHARAGDAPPDAALRRARVVRPQRLVQLPRRPGGHHVVPRGRVREQGGWRERPGVQVRALRPGQRPLRRGHDGRRRCRRGSRTTAYATNPPIDHPATPIPDGRASPRAQRSSTTAGTSSTVARTRSRNSSSIRWPAGEKRASKSGSRRRP